jgi:hypothetical protein
MNCTISENCDDPCLRQIDHCGQHSVPLPEITERKLANKNWVRKYEPGIE